MRFIGIILLFISFYAGAQRPEKSTQNTDSLQKESAKMKAANIERAAQTQYRYFVIKTANNQYGYDVYADGLLYIHQTTIPALPGNSGFSDTAKAGATARLAIQKIKQGEMPPTISIAELKQIKVIH